MIRIFFGLFLISLLPQLTFAQTITFDKFLDLLKQRHPFITKEALSSEIARKGQERFLGAKDWIINSSPFIVYQKPISLGAFQADRIISTGFNGSIARTFWNTGGRLSLSWSTDFTDQSISDIVVPLPPEISPQPFVISAGPAQIYQNGVFVTYSQPLLQNFKGKLDRLDYELSDYTIDFTEMLAQENQEGLLLDLGIRFLDWVLLSEQSKIANERRRLAEEQLGQTERKRAANLVDQVDVLRSEDAVRIAKQNTVLIESQWKAKQAELAVLAQSRDLYTQGPEFDLYKLEALPSLNNAVSRLKKRSRLLHALETQKEQLSHLRDGFVETRRPQLFLNVSAGLQEGDDGFTSSMVLDKPDIVLSLQYSYPLGNRTAQADIEKTDLHIRQLEEDVKNVELELEAGVRNLLIQIKELEKVLTLNQEQMESAKEKTQEELRLYNQGRGELTFVIQSQDNVENAKLIYAQNAASYHKLILQYRALMDELLPSISTEQR